MNRKLLVVVGLVALAAGCKPPLHLTYDYGRAFVETLRVQADLTRPSVQYAGYSLYGIEAAKIRVNVQEAATNEETATPTIQGTRGSGGGGGGGRGR